MRVEELALEHEAAFLAMVADYQKNDPAGLAALFPEHPDWSPFVFRKFVTTCEKQRLDWRPKPKQTSLTRYVMLGENEKILATALLRFPLDKVTELDGGNLVCNVPPSVRKKGHGSYCLALMLFEAVRAGLRRVLVTCESDNIGAKKMIEANRGVLEDEVKSPISEKKISRYWILFG